MLILVRHGETALNAQRRLQGRIDEPLSALGEQQAAALGEYLGEVDVVISSPLLRAQQTAQRLERPAGTSIELDDRWVEVDYGTFEGEQLEARPSEIFRRWQADPAFVPPDGESLVAVGERVDDACRSLMSQAADQDVAVVTHVSPMKAAVAWALGAAPAIAWRSHLSVAAICRIDVRDQQPVLLSFNELLPALVAERRSVRFRG